MFSERHYARDTGRYDNQGTSALVWLLCAIGAGFVLQAIFERAIPGGAPIPAQAAALVPGLFLRGHVWTLLTYTLLHVNILHLIVNGLTIYFMGRETLPLLGNRRFGWFCAAAAAGGGLLWLLVNFRDPGSVLIGASSISCALLMLFACFYPDNKITLVLFFIIPVSVRPKYVAGAAAAFDLFGLLFYEIPGKHFSFAVAHSAHIGGMLVALGYYFLICKRVWRQDAPSPSDALPEWLQKKKKPAVIAAPKYKVNITSRDDLKAELDRILDKINSQGFASLTDEEKHTLDSAKDILSGR
ncbi:MAG: rhomboid family intramembrane serine protease [Opitutaceae bacterium]|jgi:membrane associated rhomboid family serine protease|nr:rhomboid family intramembrane serine protease [Opitutaceae bacterium]